MKGDVLSQPIGSTPEMIQVNYCINKVGEIVNKSTGKCPECKPENHLLNVQLVNVFQSVLPHYLKDRGKFHELPNTERQFYASHSWDTAEEDNKPLLIFLAGPRVRYKAGVLNVRVLLETGGGILAATILGYLERCLQLHWHFITLSPLFYGQTPSHPLENSEALLYHFLTSVILPNPDEEALHLTGCPPSRRSRSVYVIAHGLTGPALLHPLRPSPGEIFAATHPSLEHFLQLHVNATSPQEDTFMEDLNAYCAKHFATSSVPPANGGAGETSAVPEEPKSKSGSQTKGASGATGRIGGRTVLGHESPFPALAEGAVPPKFGHYLLEESGKQNKSSSGDNQEQGHANFTTPGGRGSTTNASGAKPSTTTMNSKFACVTRLIQETELSTRVWHEHARLYLSQLERCLSAVIFLDSVVDLHAIPITDKDALRWIQRHCVHFLPCDQPKGTRLTFMKDILSLSAGVTDNVKVPRNVLDDIFMHCYRCENRHDTSFVLPPLDFTFLNDYVKLQV